MKQETFETLKKVEIDKALYAILYNDGKVFLDDVIENYQADGVRLDIYTSNKFDCMFCKIVQFSGVNYYIIDINA